MMKAYLAFAADEEAPSMRKLRLLLVPVVLAALAAVVAGTANASDSNRSGAVYTLTNSPAGNAVAVFDRAQDGSLTPAGTFTTGGNGTGAGLGSQGALAISADGKLLFAVNAASNTISELAISPQAVQLIATVPSGGTHPISVAVNGNLVYALNDGGAGNISGFTATNDGLTPLAGSTRALHAGAAGPAEVAFSPNGAFLVVTEKTSNTIDTFAVDGNGIAGAPASTSSAGTTPFGFTFDNAGQLLVSEAGTQSASSYTVDATGAHTITGPVSDGGQAGACWLISTNDGRFAYTANAGSATISGFSVAANGALALVNPVAASLGAGGHPLDLAVSGKGDFLYNLTDGHHAITGYAIAADGSLTQVTVAGGLPAGAIGIVAS